MIIQHKASGMIARPLSCADHPLTAALELGVPLRIQHLRQYGGPGTLDIERAREGAELIAMRGDDLLFGGAGGHISADLMTELIHMIAVMAFVPGGIKAFGMHWES
jgi:hypothetical protein